MLCNLHHASNLGGVGPPARPARRSRAASSSSWAAWAVRLIGAVLRDALATQRDYERLRRKGLPDAIAIRRAFFDRQQ